MMRLLVVSLLLFIASFVSAHFFVLSKAPARAMEKTINAISASGLETNTIRHATKVGPQSRRVVRPAPDLAYSTCLYDVSQTPVVFKAPGARRYFSLSLYADNTDNFFVANDRDLNGQDLSVLLVNKSIMRRFRSFGQMPEGYKVIEARSDKGIGLFRTIIPSEGEWPEVDRFRRGFDCFESAALSDSSAP